MSTTAEPQPSDTDPLAATGVVEPGTGLTFVELSHEWGHHTPVFPGFDDIRIHRAVTHAAHGVMSQHIVTVMHNGTHVNAPIHMVQRAQGVGELPLDRFFGSGVVVAVPKEEWEVVGPEDLEDADINPGDIVILNTGWHRFYSDSQRYFGHAPGLSREAAELLADRGAKLVGVDTATVDHPLATSLGPHRGGPLIRQLPGRYEERTGRKALEDFPDWNPAHRLLLGRGIPTIENVGGDLDAVTGKRCTFHAYPWHWPEGDACVIRLVAIFDPSGEYRLAAGN
jgi:kynurenine formamidase